MKQGHDPSNSLQKIVNAVRAHLEHEFRKHQYPDVFSPCTASREQRWPEDPT